MDVLQNSHKFRVLWHGRTELTEVPGGYKKCCTRTPGCRTGRTELTEVPGTGMNVLQNSQNFRVRVRKSYRTSRSTGYCGTGLQNSQKFRAGIKVLYPYPGFLWYERTELAEVPGTGISVVSYRTYRSSGYRY